jgi:hypothetical protein
MRLLAQETLANVFRGKMDMVEKFIASMKRRARSSPLDCDSLARKRRSPPIPKLSLFHAHDCWSHAGHHGLDTLVTPAIVRRAVTTCFSMVAGIGHSGKIYESLAKFSKVLHAPQSETLRVRLSNPRTLEESSLDLNAPRRLLFCLLARDGNPAAVFQLMPPSQNNITCKRRLLVHCDSPGNRLRAIRLCPIAVAIGFDSSCHGALSEIHDCSQSSMTFQLVLRRPRGDDRARRFMDAINFSTISILPRKTFARVYWAKSRMMLGRKPESAQSPTKM